MMNNDREFFTVTMAKVYITQGHLQKATEIYRHLLERSPDRTDILDALTALEEKKPAGESGRNFPLQEKRVHWDSQGLPELFDTWIRLLIRHDNIRRLRKISLTEKTVIE